MIATTLGGIGLFLLGMVLLTDGLKAAAGDALRRVVARFTGGPFTALLSGAGVTVLVQSSSATTLTTIGFVSAGLLTFPQAIGVIFGAAVGTTSTGWIVSLLGIHELATVTGHADASALFDRSSEGLLRLLDRYDVGWWSLYSLYDHGSPDLAKPFYQRFHPVLLRALDLVRPDSRFRAMAARWERQITRLALLRVSANKVRFRLTRARSSGH
jgi:hypothetical protein